MISMLFGTKPRDFFENSKFSSSSGAWPTGSGARRGEGFTFCSTAFSFLSASRRRGLTGRRWRPAKACPKVRGARRDQADEPRVDHRFGVQEVQSAEHGYPAQ